MRLGKKGDQETFSIMILLKAVFAMALIALMAWFVFLIISAVMPSNDKATLKSFETFYSVINAKSLNTKYYDSTTLSLTINTDYRIVMFPKGDRIECGASTGGKVKMWLLKPESCDLDKNCLCLFKGPTSKSEDPDLRRKNDDVVECKVFKNAFTTKAYELNTDQCEKVEGQKFFNVIVAENTVNKAQDMYVWLDNEKNRALDEDFQKAKCMTGEPICIGKNEGSYISDQSKYDEIYNKCKDTLSARCISGANGGCTLECSSNKLDCTQFKSCADYSKYSDEGSLIDKRFLLSGSAAEWVCGHDLCKVNSRGCIVLPATYYYCTDGDKCNDVLFSESVVASCSLAKLDFIEPTKNIHVLSASSEPSCEDAITKTLFSQTSPLYVLKPGMSHDDILLNSQLQQDCGFIISTKGDVIIIRTPNSAQPNCVSMIQGHLLETKNCQTLG